jgi:hypothetical protein
LPFLPALRDSAESDRTVGVRYRVPGVFTVVAHAEIAARVVQSVPIDMIDKDFRIGDSQDETMKRLVDVVTVDALAVFDVELPREVPRFVHDSELQGKREIEVLSVNGDDVGADGEGNAHD